MLAAQIIVWLAIAYLATGVLFGAYFVFAKIGDFDESAKSAGFGFRLIILFGMLAFWPLILYRFMRGFSQPLETNRHRRTAGEGQE